MTLPFALRTRIDFREPPRRTRSFAMPKLAGPIGAYWGAMGLLAYGVSTGALPLDEWFWPRADEAPSVVESEPAVESAEPSPPPSRVTPFPAEPESPAPVEVEAAPIARDETERPLAAQLPQPVDEVAPEPAPVRANEPRRLTLSLAYTPAPQDEQTPVRAPEERALAAAEPRPRATKLPAREPRPEPTSHLAWNEPVWGAAQPSQRTKLTSPDAARGSRHVMGPNSGDFLFPDEPARADSGRAPRAAIAAVAPRLEPDRDDSRRDAEPARPARAVGSCEAAAATASDEMDLTKSDRGAPDVTRDAYASILDNGRYLSSCRIPGGVRFDICAAVRDGRAVGITVTTSPKNAAVAACVRAAVSRLSFPISPRLDVTRTRFEPVR